MAVDNSLSSLLATLTTSIESATQALPEDGILPPKEGISLLDVKNELLLSYLQNLVFLILLKLRSRRSGSEDDSELGDEVVKKLVELRVYLDKGVRPLENRLKYQIDKIIRSADDAARKTNQAAKESSSKRAVRKTNPDDSDFSDAESADADEDAEADDMSYGPNSRRFVRAESPASKRKFESSKNGIYMPPRITPTTMPTTQPRQDKEARRAGKSATLDEFVATELSTAPLAEPSIGSTIVSGGRRVKTDRERREEAEKREYEESNFTRLPAGSKKDQAKAAARNRGGFGGEEWKGLGAGLDRIERLTQKKGGSSNSLERSRKRPISDGPRGSGMQAGDAFEQRRNKIARYRK